MKALTFIVCCAIALQGYSQVLCKWTADSSSATAAEFQCYRGETLQFQPTLKQYGAVISNATYTLQWQTNGMGTSYWSTNILQFTPAMDVGANAYTVFIRAETTNGVSYRANAKIKMLGSPGATPNVIPLPVQRIDFASVQYLNAPWLLSADLDPVESRIEGVEAGTNVWNAAAAWGNHASAGYLASSVWLSWLGTNTYIKAESDPTVPAHVKAITEGQVTAWDAGTNRSDRTYTLYGYTNAWQTVENGTATVWRIENGADISSAILTVTEPLTIDGGGVVLPVGIYTSIVESAGVFIWSHNGTAFGYYTYSPGIPLTACLLFEDDSSAWYGHNGDTGTYVFPDVMTNLYGTAIGGKVTVDYGRTMVTNAYPLATAGAQAGLSGQQVTNIVEAVRELHVDSYTNIIWRSVYSNGWMWLVAYTNYPAQ
jgi:hypothetical protein